MALLYSSQNSFPSISKLTHILTGTSFLKLTRPTGVIVVLATVVVVVEVVTIVLT